MHRVDQCEFDVGVFTNLSPDHLDYHGTMEKYRDAKAELFRMVDGSVEKGIPKAAVLNADDLASAYMREQTRARALTYGGESGDIYAVDVESFPAYTRFTAGIDGDEVEARVPLLGGFNVANSLGAIAVAITQGIPLRGAAAALASFPGVPGRMELIDAGQPFRVLVDIASTEQAMRNVLGVLRPITAGRLIVVFGAAGERDRERRSGLARTVSEASDYAIITNEDPRSEDPEAIIDEIAQTLASSGFDPSRVERIADRRSAIARAFEYARREDTVLLAGKGTEQSIVIGTTHHPWDERTVARELLGRLVADTSSSV
jgi:UDP-N-acetylmuramoyl-L-alanyl-D-glutamate--2,6-diaminopimelate ligase